MNNRESRTMSSMFVSTRGSRPRRLFDRVGRAVGLDESAASRFGAFESLETRAMLEGSFATAILVTLDGAGRGSAPGVINPAVASTDNDYYRFVAPANDFVRVLADTANEATTSTLNDRVSIYNDAFTLIAQGSNNGTLTTGVQRDGWSGFLAEAGRTYFVVVSSDYAGPAPNLTSGNTFTLQLAAISNTFILDPNGSGIAIDPATPAPPPDQLWPVRGNLAFRQDDQVWTYTAATTSLVTLNAQHNRYNAPFLPGSSIPNRLDTRLEVYNSAGALLSQDSDAGRVNDAFTSFKATQGQTYYIRVRSDEVRARQPANPAFDVTLATGNFWLVADTASQDVPLNQVVRRATVNDAFAGFDDPTPPAPAPISTPTFQTQNYTFQAAGDGLAIITVTPTGLAPVTDPAVRLFDKDGALITYNDNFAGLAAQLEVRLVGGQQYYVVVDGFEINSAVQFILNIEAEHTFNNSTGALVDDHVNTPPLTQSPTPAQRDQMRRVFSLATGLTWSDPAVTLDENNNEVRDRGLRSTAVGTGRIHTSADTDLFQFTAPGDMLIDYGGNNDDAGTSLFVGGIFDFGSNNTPWLTGSRNLATWDANDWWYTGAQYFDAQFNVTYGFNDNADTAGTTGPEIYAMTDYDPGLPQTVPTGMNRRWLIVGGDFDLIVPTPFGPATLKNLAVWFQDFNTGLWSWGSLGDVNGPVRAMTSFTPDETVPELNDPGIDVPTNRPTLGGTPLAYLILGGEFTEADGVAASNIARWDALNGFRPIGAGADGPVFALTVYDAPDVGDARAGQPGPPILPEVNDSRDIPISLYVGGNFTSLDGTSVSNLGYWDGEFTDAVWAGPAGIPRPAAAGPNGPVFALTSYIGWDPDGEGGEIEAPSRVLVIGGQFTSIADGEGTNIAASNLAAWGFIGAATTRPGLTPPPPLSRDNQSVNYAPQAGWQQVDAGITDPNSNGDGPVVLALAEWDPPDINNTTIDPVLVVGGSFSVFGAIENLVAFAVNTETGAADGFVWFNNSEGTNGTVRAITTLTDAQEPGIATDLNSGVPQEVLYIGGDFTEVTNGDLADPVAANHVAQFAAFHDPLSGQDFFYFTSLLGGVGNTNSTLAPLASVFALSPFDDGNPLAWDRHDRPATRLSIVVSPASGSFANMRVRVFDSNMNIVYGFQEAGSETIAPPFPDPAGMNDTSLVGPPLDTTFDGIKVWGGETYYIEISSLGGTDDFNPVNRGGTGRYNFTVIADGIATDLNSDEVLDDVNGPGLDEPNDGRFIQSIAVNLPLGSGDGSNYVAADTQPLHGNTARNWTINPSTNLSFQTRGDIGNISTINDTDLYSFRAQFDGFVELRISTSLILDSYGEQYGTDFRGDSDFVSSWLDSALRVFRNDFEQIAYNDDNAAIRGEFADVFFGVLDRDVTTPAELDPFRFYDRDARVIVPVVAGNVYYIQVESGQRWVDGSPILLEDRVDNVSREIDVRRTTGAYQLLINAMPLLDNDIEGGQTVFDDHIDFNGAGPGNNFATPIRLGDLTSGSDNGLATFSGVINNTPLKPSDQDLFSFITPGSGTLIIQATRPVGSLLNPTAILFDPATGNQVAVGTPISGGGSRIEFSVQKGDEFILLIAGTGGTEGAYDVAISGVPEVDDYADFGKLWNASTITLRDFLGQGQATGRINAPGDIDVFRFSFETFWTSITFNVRSLDATLDPTVTIYEVSEDPATNPILLTVGFNDNASATTNDSRVTVPITPDRGKFPPGGPDRLYPYYYVVVRGANLNADEGRYELNMSFPATDDHPDATPEDVPSPTTVDTSEFSFATRIVVDSATGLGNSVGNIEQVGDTDLFQFTAPAGGPAQIVISRPGSSLIRTRVFLTDSFGTVLGSGTAQDSTIFITAATSSTVVRNNTYFIVVEGFEDEGVPNVNTTVTGNYTVSVTAPPIDDHPNAGEFNLATGMIFNLSSGLAQIGGNAANDPLNPRLSPTNDTDLFTFTTLLSGSQVVTVTPFLAGGNFSPRITIFDALFNQIAQVSGSAVLEEMTVTITGALQGSRYYVLVSAVSGVPGATLTGEYRLRVQGPVPPDGSGPDPSEIDFNAPLSVTLDSRTGDGSRFDQINPSGDRDLFSFTTSSAGRIFIQVVTPSGSLLDASVTVLSAANENSSSVVVFDADGFAGITAQATFDGLANKQYWVIVDGLGASVGSYEIRINTQPLTNRLFFPEGFANGNIREFLSIINPGNSPANYTVYIRYEWGQLETVLSSGVVAPHSRDGLTIIDGPFFQTPGILNNVPYAIIIDSDQPLGATMAHYDFGSAVGDSFTETLSARWNFARVERNPGLVRDFIVLYNPNNFDINVTLTANQNGQTVSVTQSFQALRRGGFSIDALGTFPLGTFGVVMTAAAANPANQAAFQGVVASISHYSVTGGSAFSVIGSPVTPDSPQGGSTRGVITNIMQGSKVSSEIVFFNSGLTTATVTLAGNYIRTQGLPAFTRVFDIPARSIFTISGSSLGLVADQPVGLRWTSNVAINALGSEQQFGDGDSTQPATTAARQYYFGDAYIDVPQAGNLYFETMFFHNPTNVSSNVTVRLVFLDGTTSSFNVSMGPGGFAEVKLHERPEIIQQRTGRQWFAVDASSTKPFIASMQHYDLFLGGGWATSGVPFDISTNLARIT
ncbi:hypothetical protein PHYC_00430 [Phycisphaerales bacterium]|nr:hypothetical protein PHYC_00430 [Phycisphaerales bacterium]